MAVTARMHLTGVTALVGVAALALASGACTPAEPPVGRAAQPSNTIPAPAGPAPAVAPTPSSAPIPASCETLCAHIEACTGRPEGWCRPDCVAMAEPDRYAACATALSCSDVRISLMMNEGPLGRCSSLHVMRGRAADAGR